MSYTRSKIKREIIKNRIEKDGYYCCDICAMPPVWCDKPVVFVLDHIDGINDNNLPENLRLLCPNCNSQTSTFCGRNVKRAEKVDLECPHCLNKFKVFKREVKKRKFCSYRCSSMANKNCLQIGFKKIKIETKEIVDILKNNKMNFCKVGRILGVSDNAIRKRYKKYLMDPH